MTPQPILAPPSQYGHVATPLASVLKDEFEQIPPPADRRRLQQLQLQPVFEHLQHAFGFQPDSVTNQQEALESFIISSMSGEDEIAGLRAVHAKVISGEAANYRKWYVTVADLFCQEDFGTNKEYLHDFWQLNVVQCSDEQALADLALYFLLLGEASNLRFCPELICFIFKLTKDALVSSTVPLSTEPYLAHIVKPLYGFLCGQLYREVNGQLVRRTRDHAEIIGYDDVNESFWDVEFMRRLRLDSGELLMSLDKIKRYGALNRVQWQFEKTYFERRTILHLLVNFPSIFLFHLVAFYYLLLGSTMSALFENVNVGRCILGLGGALATMVSIFIKISELFFVTPKTRRSILLALLKDVGVLVLSLVIPALVLFRLFRLPDGALTALGIVQVVWSLLVSLFVVSFRGQHSTKNALIADFVPLPNGRRWISVGLWSLVVVSKIFTSYVFLIMPFAQSFVNINAYILMAPSLLGQIHGAMTLGLLVLLNLTLFHLDTYVWFVIWTTVVGVAKLLYSQRPWQDSIESIPERIHSKLTNVKAERVTGEVSATIWNAIVISFFNNHLISKEQLKSLLFKPLLEPASRLFRWVKPQFFGTSEAANASTVGLAGEAMRRISFLARSLNIISPPQEHNQTEMTVLIPHYSERILWTLNELMQGDHEGITVLDYLKQLHPTEWNNFVLDSMASNSLQPNLSQKALGFSNANEVLRTRIWASLRSQTLFRTVAGFANYEYAMSICSRLENKAGIGVSLLVAMQKYGTMDKSALADVELMLKTFPSLRIAYIDQTPNQSSDTKFYCCLVDAQCPLKEDLRRTPRFRIELPGPPILGDGKADNQNQAIIFTRGNYLQMIDANQDHYLEECFKLQHLLAEFQDQVAIVGAREHIFSERIGALGDSAAGKEYCFGTMTQRTLALLGARMCYGHPDVVDVSNNFDLLSHCSL